MIVKDNKKDPHFIYKLERNVKAYMLYTIIILAFIIVLLALAISFLTPLKETKPYLVMFSNAESNFVKIAEANLDIRSDVGLLKSIISGYVQNRESINRIDDIQRYELIRVQSDRSVWEAFQNLVKSKNSVYTTSNLYRAVKIINVAILSKNVATVDFTIEQSNKQRTELRWFNYRATLNYDFVPNEDTYSSNLSNPTGFVVKEYALSNINFNEKEKQ
ncbi:type IV secretion system protein [Campylobacter cuniculorum]|uniref:Type IV secretion system protein VirB8 n=2 Tax=Campylobacter cuniculorum TaxID=374106 RepID=A0A1W6BYJ6_9BACT|nr:VirB8/TrbF family protein [Campylobacter cuniculorum]ARJ57142.1 type IV secretion system protein VirB8 [Campylobacter cuniculorum DSM 23162 = LMG 24588]QOR04584.1 virulence protein [Campylobacter cuniculorum]